MVRAFCFAMALVDTERSQLRVQNFSVDRKNTSDSLAYLGDTCCTKMSFLALQYHYHSIQDKPACIVSSGCNVGRSAGHLFALRATVTAELNDAQNLHKS